VTVIAAQPPVPAALDGVVSEVLASRRYRWLAPEFVARLAGDAVRRTRRPADAVKETKRRLHQVFGAYVQDLDHKRMINALESAASEGPDALRETARGLMSQHASTRERLPALDRFYRELFAVTGPPRHVLDLACGLAPLALPWMTLPAGARYDAIDVDRRFVQIAHTCLRLFGVDGDAALRDVAGDPPSRPADVALLLKAVPCFEQQAPGSAARVLDAVHARWLVVSFPTRSLGGTGKGMVSHYRAMMEQLSAARAWRVHELLLPVELVFVVEKAAGAG
jgi:16S rRNA (guanine(1405)-N(7))-methyltransferase